MSNKQVLIIGSKMFYTEKVHRYGTKRYFKDGKLHRDGDEPAVIWSNGTKEYYKNGKSHRDGDKPAVIWSDGAKWYYKNGKLHRDGDEPAVINSDGTIKYFKTGKLHRDGDKPAIDSNGYKEYFKNGKCHRDGVKPAIEHTDESKWYYKNGVKYTKEQVEKMEEIRTRIVNRTLKRCARYWYDETYRNPEGEAFKRRMMADIDELENDIGYKLT